MRCLLSSRWVVRDPERGAGVGGEARGSKVGWGGVWGVRKGWKMLCSRRGFVFGDACDDVTACVCCLHQWCVVVEC
jgi:hypothetical protein